MCIIDEIQIDIVGNIEEGYMKFIYQCPRGMSVEVSSLLYT